MRSRKPWSVPAVARWCWREPGGRLAPRVTDAGGEVVPFPAAAKNPFKLLANARAIARLVHRERVDLIHARSRAPAWSALLAARRLRVPFVTTYHGAYGEKNWAKRLYNGVMARGDVTIANSGYTADLIAQRYGTPRQRIVVIHRGVDTRQFDPERVGPERVAALRAGWGVDDASRIILHMARLTGWKGQSVLIEAAAQLKAAGKLQGAVVVLAGDAQGRNAYLQALQHQIAQAGLESSVRFVGHVEDVAAAFLAAHVAVVASTEPEAFGRAAIEAAAMGCPVIATAIGAPPETVLAEPADCRGCHHGLAGPGGRCRGPGPPAGRGAGARRSRAGSHGQAVPGRMFWPNSRWRPCNSVRWRSTTGCWEPSLNGVLSTIPLSDLSWMSPRDNLDLRYYLSDSGQCAEFGRYVRFDGYRSQRPVQQPMETATYVVQ